MPRWSRKIEDRWGASPVMYRGWDAADERVTSFKFKEDDLLTPSAIGTARLYWRVGWTAIIFWNDEVYFADGVYGFDEMLDLVKVRYGQSWEFSIDREYEDD